MTRYSRKNLQTKLNAAIKKVKDNSVDKKAATKMLDEVLSLQKQIDVEPTEVHVAESEVIARYDFGAFSLIRCKTCIIFKTTGYRLIAKPIYTTNEDGGVLYSQLSALCDMKDQYNTVDKTQQELWNLVFNLSITILSLPIDAFASDKFLFEVGKFIVEKKVEMQTEKLNKALKEETVEDEIKNDEFRQMVEMSEDSKEEEKNA